MVQLCIPPSPSFQSLMLPSLIKLYPVTSGVQVGWRKLLKSFKSSPIPSLSALSCHSFLLFCLSHIVSASIMWSLSISSRNWLQQSGCWMPARGAMGVLSTSAGLCTDIYRLGFICTSCGSYSLCCKFILPSCFFFLFPLSMKNYYCITLSAHPCTHFCSNACQSGHFF